jgi:hypothetical protein
MRPPSAGRRAAGGQASSMTGMVTDGGGAADGYYHPPEGTAAARGHPAAQYAQAQGMKMVGAWGVGVEDSRFESLAGIASSSPMICSPPMSPQSVRACPSPSSQMRMLFAHTSQISSELSSASTVGRDNVPALEKAYSDDLMRGPASMPSRMGGGMVSVGGGPGDDVSLSQEKIASRLSILKTRRGRTSSSRRGGAPNAMSAPANETPLLGLGDTHPAASLFASTMHEARQADGAGLLDPEAGAAAYARPSQSAPSLSGSKGQPTGLGVSSSKADRALDDRENRMQVEGGAAGAAQRSAMDISAKPLELVPTEDLKPCDNPEACMRTLISKLGSRLARPRLSCPPRLLRPDTVPTPAHVRTGRLCANEPNRRSEGFKGAGGI